MSAPHPAAPQPASVPPAVGRPLRRWPTRPWPLHTLLFVTYAVLFLFAENLTEVTFGDVVAPLGRALIGAAAVLMVAAVLTRDLRRGGIIASGLLVAWFAYGHVNTLVAPMIIPRDQQLMGWTIFLAIVILGAVFLKDSWIALVTKLLDVVAAVLVGLTVIRIVPFEFSRPALAAVPASVPDTHVGDRDIYYIVYDRYGSNRSVGILTGAEDDLPAWLESRGFYVAPQAHANYGRTSMSLAATLNMSTLDEVAARMGPHSGDLSPVYAMLQEHKVGLYLKARGYRYVHVGSWFAPTKTIRIADENLQMAGSTDFEAILEQTTFQPTAESMERLATPPAHHVLHRNTALFQFRAFEQVRHEPGPKFVMLHILLPHEPYVFDANGDYPSFDVQRTRTEAEGYEGQLLYSNTRIKQMVDALLAEPEATRPIIILQGDEGPYPLRYQASQGSFDWSIATTDELEMKYGILHSMYLPGPPPASAAAGSAAAPAIDAPNPSMTSLDTFPIIFNRYFGENMPLFPQRSWTSTSINLPYGLTDVTARLPSLNGDTAPWTPPTSPVPQPSVDPDATDAGPEPTQAAGE